MINEQFEEIASTAEGLNTNFASQITEDNNKMLSVFDALQSNVVLLKVDMVQALNIKIDYVDADGD